MQTSYVLGAGFSKAIDGTMPLTKDVGIEINKMIAAGEIVMSSNVLVPEFETGSVTFEDWLSYLIERQPFETEDEYLPKLSDSLQIRRAIWIVVQKAQDQVDCKESPEWVGDFMQRIYSEKSAVITLNYDVVFERLFQLKVEDKLKENPLEIIDNNGKHHRKTSHDLMPYMGGSYAAMSSPILEGDLGGGSSFSPPYLYKLHGSTDWVILPDDELGVSVKKHFPAQTVGFPDSWFSIKERRSLSRGYQELIVPPTQTKSAYYKNSFIRSIWHEALNLLKASQRIVVFGYSLPQADYSMMQMLIEGVHHGIDDELKIAEIIFINPSDEPYKRFIKNINGKGDGFGLPWCDIKAYQYQSYSDYAERHGKESLSFPDAATPEQDIETL